MFRHPLQYPRNTLQYPRNTSLYPKQALQYPRHAPKHPRNTTGLQPGFSRKPHGITICAKVIPLTIRTPTSLSTKSTTSTCQEIITLPRTLHSLSIPSVSLPRTTQRPTQGISPIATPGLRNHSSQYPLKEERNDLCELVDNVHVRMNLLQTSMIVSYIQNLMTKL